MGWAIRYTKEITAPFVESLANINHFQQSVGLSCKDSPTNGFIQFLQGLGFTAT